MSIKRWKGGQALDALLVKSQTVCEATEPAALDESRQGLIDCRPPCQVKEIVGRENAAASAAADAPHNSIRG